MGTGAAVNTKTIQCRMLLELSIKPKGFLLHLQKAVTIKHLDKVAKKSLTRRIKLVRKIKRMVVREKNR